MKELWRIKFKLADLELESREMIADFDLVHRLLISVELNKFEYVYLPESI